LPSFLNNSAEILYLIPGEMAIKLNAMQETKLRTKRKLEFEYINAFKNKLNFRKICTINLNLIIA